jgi:hypothetical protein
MHTKKKTKNCLKMLCQHYSYSTKVEAVQTFKDSIHYIIHCDELIE